MYPRRGLRVRCCLHTLSTMIIWSSCAKKKMYNHLTKYKAVKIEVVFTREIALKRPFHWSHHNIEKHSPEYSDRRHAESFILIRERLVSDLVTIHAKCPDLGASSAVWWRRMATRCVKSLHCFPCKICSRTDTARIYATDFSHLIWKASKFS